MKVERLGSRKRKGWLARQCLSLLLAIALIVSAVPVFPGMSGEVQATDELVGSIVEPALLTGGTGVVGDEVYSPEGIVGELEETIEPIFPMMRMMPQSTGDNTKPVLVVSGTGIIAGGTYTKDNIGNEKSYTLAELQAMANGDANSAENNRYLFSAYNTYDNASVYLGEGVRLVTLLGKSGIIAENFDKNIIALNENKDNPYSVKYDPAKNTVGSKDNASTSQHLAITRYYYPNIKAAGAGNDSNSREVPTILAWAKGGTKSSTVEPTTVVDLGGKLESMTGQIALNDYNNPAFNSNVGKVLVGDTLSASVIIIAGKSYTRSEILMMERAEGSFTYTNSKSEEITNYARGVPLAALVKGKDLDEIISFTAADGYDLSGASVSIADAIAKNYILAYEKGDNANSLGAIFEEGTLKDKVTPYKGYFAVYQNGEKPLKSINSISITPAGYTDYTNSPYKHINNGGLPGPGKAPYNIDAITGATLTVEGPGVEATTPILMGDLEKTNNKNIYRGDYTDDRGSGSVTFSYEGVQVLAIIDGLINNTVKKVDEKITIVFKNRWRQDIGRITYNELKNATTPVILAYGTGTTDGKTVAPFVFDKATGVKAELANDDGCLKLVYDKAELTKISNNAKFASVAYVYVERGDGRPGYKHSEATNDAYKNTANTEHFITFTGKDLGREVNYTVAELEKMVEYDGDIPKIGGLGHRAEYSLSNTTYWYVNEYEGIKLWDLLTTKLGLDANTYKEDNNTLVSIAAWDNYKTTAQFSMKQLANPDLFYFYEKSPLDIGTDRPTKEQLATQEYKPDNTVGEWTIDSNGYPVKKGYPVMLAYGVNGYPYVRDSRLEGYAGGLGNDGGPMRVIFGKTDGMNRGNPGAEENYAYFYNNGSNQLQRAQEIYIGDNKRYSTHMDNPAYAAMKDNPALTVEIKQGGTTETKTYTFTQLESILYGVGVSKSEMEKQGRKEKGYYFHKVYQSELLEDLFEGVNLWYLLSEDIGMQGVLGSVTLYSGNDAQDPIPLTDLQAKGSNSLRNTDNLGAMVAFAKNGYPMVFDSKSPGYVKDDFGKTIQNRDGPLMFVQAQTEAEKAAGRPGQTIKNLTKIVVNLEADVYAHTDVPYLQYGNNEINFTGAVKNEGVTLKVSDIEKLQKFMVTDTYNIGGVINTYRGVDLGKLLSSSSVGASALLDKVTITNANGDSKVITVSDIRSATKPIILAYGIGKAGAEPIGKPLVPDASSGGYAADYLNNGGPLKLIINGAIGSDCIENVTGISVTASELTGWTHSTGYYAAYKKDTLELSGTNLSQTKFMTVEELENLPQIYKAFDKYKMSNEYYFEGIDLLKLFRDYIGFSGGMESSNITVYAKDNYAITFTATDLLNGVNGKPIILAYGQGTSASKGLPLVGGGDQTDIKDGFDAEIGNAFGPLRLIVNDNSGWCNKWVTKIVVGSAGSVEPPAKSDFVLKNKVKDTSYDIKAIKSITEGQGGKATANYTYTSKDVKKTEYVKGVYLKDLLKAAGISGAGVKVTINTTDGYESKQANYQDIPLADLISKNYFLAYDAGDSVGNEKKISDKDRKDVEATVRIYRNFDDGNTWFNCLTNIKGITVDGTFTFTVFEGTGQPGNLPIASIRSIVTDANGGMWVGTNGGGAWYKPSNKDEFTINTLSTEGYKLKSDLVRAIAIDSGGGIWFTQGNTYDPAKANLNKGVAYLKDGIITYYDSSIPNTIPNDYVQEVQIDKSGNVWFGSFGGLTKYNPTTKEWTTWDQSYKDSKGGSFPAVSVDNLTFDGKGGMWIAFYPNGAGTEADPFVGGFAHMTADGNITPYKFTAEYDPVLQSSLLAQVWVRDIAVDSSGGAWVVASGSYGNLANVGGTVWYVDNTGKTTKYTGKELLGIGKLTGNSELRMVSVDSKGGLWLGTSEDGLFYVANPSKAAPLTITAQYNGAKEAWPNTPQFNNIYVQNIIGDNMYLGSNAGVMIAPLKDIATTGGGTGPGGGDKPIPGDYDLIISGAGVNQTTYYSIKDLKNAPGINRVTRSYSHLNSYGTTGTDTFEGVYLDNLLNVVGLSSSAQSVTVMAGDGYHRTFNLDSAKLGVYWTDIQGNKIMLAWKRNGSPCDLQLVIGQTDTKHINKPMWVSNIVSITVNSSATSDPGGGSKGSYEQEKDKEKEKEKEKLEQPKVNEVEVKTVVTGNKATTEVAATEIAKVIENLQKSQKEDGKKENLIVEISAVSGNKETVNHAQVSIPADSIKALAKEANITATIKTDLGNITLPPVVLQQLDTKSTEPIIINIQKAEEVPATTQVKERPVVSITISQGSREIANFGENHVKIAIDYVADVQENNNQLLIYYINAQGKASPVKLSKYNTETGQVMFGTNHLSLYAVGYNEVSFTDIENHWGQENIEFLAAREIIKGKELKLFDPNGSVTRAEYVTMLANCMDNITVAGAKDAGFTDVLTGAWYADYVNWAVVKGIVSGYGDNRFAPNEKITREQMALMTDKFIKAMQVELEKINKETSFADQATINTWSKGAVSNMQQAGIINGTPEGNFLPQGTATRGEAATIIKGYIEALLR